MYKTPTASFPEPVAIIAEELEGWLSRDKSQEEATTIIQSRIQLLLDEDA